MVLTPDGRHVWGTADAAFTRGLAGAEPGGNADTDDPAHFPGVHPIDEAVGRGPTAARSVDEDRDDSRPHGRVLRRRSAPSRRPGSGCPWGNGAAHSALPSS